MNMRYHYGDAGERDTTWRPEGQPHKCWEAQNGKWLRMIPPPDPYKRAIPATESKHQQNR